MANLYDLKKFDLNLLVIFECIYQHLSISKAAETLFITPSAVSQSLQRLRGQLNDPLFIRAGKGITPTTVAVNLHHHLDNNLNQLEETIQLMSRTDITKKFVIYAPQMAVLSPFTDLLASLREDPHLYIEHHDMYISNDSADELLSYRKADLIITTSPSHSRSVVSKELGKFDLSIVCSRSHPRISDSATREELLQEEYAVYRTNEPSVKQIGIDEKDFFHDRQVCFSSNSTFAILNTVAHSDLLAIMPKAMVAHFAGFLNIKTVETPLKIQSLHLYMIYNRSSLANSSFADFMKRFAN